MTQTGLKDTQNLSSYLPMLAGRKVLVIGDVMLDRFVYGEVKRVSPEAPVPVLSYTHDEYMLGGAGNVVSNLSALGLSPFLIGVIGKDDAAERVRQILNNMGVKSGHLVVDETRPTIEKTRYVGGGQHLLRVDSEKVGALDADDEGIVLAHAEQLVPQVAAIVLSDYAKGVLSDRVIKNVIAMARDRDVPVIVDPKRPDFSIYDGANVITPNRKELSAATSGHSLASDADISAACKELKPHLPNVQALVATRSEAGMSVFSIRDEAMVHIKNSAREVYDVSGAGDTVIAVLAALLGCGADIASAARLANIAAGIAVSKIGTTAVSLDELTAALAWSKAPEAQSGLPQHAVPKICDWEEAAAKIRSWQARGLRVGFTNGCFDILHYGHVSYLNQARARCDRLVVGINHDRSVGILKGPTRPVNEQIARASVIGALGSVDMTVFFGAEEKGQDNTPCALLDVLRPDIIFKGGDYQVEDLPEAKIVQAYGGAVEIMPLYEGHSTTAIIERSADGKSGAAE